MDKVGNGGKGIAWNTETEVEQLGELNGIVTGRRRDLGMPKIETDIDACEVVLQLAPETNGHVAVKAWEALGKQTGRDHTHLALHREDEKIRFRDIQAQPRKIISSPTWSGIESRDRVATTPATPTCTRLIPWRTLTGRQQFYLDHPWMIAFGEGFSSYRPPVDLKTTAGIQDIKPNGNKEIAAELHHAAPEVGHPLHLHRQPDDADAEPRRPGGLAERRRRQERRHRRQRLGRGLQHQRRDRGACGGQPARQPRHGDDVPRAGKDHQHAGLAKSPACAAASTTR